jgi:hypothetical protein
MCLEFFNFFIIIFYFYDIEPLQSKVHYSLLSGKSQTYVKRPSTQIG